MFHVCNSLLHSSSFSATPTHIRRGRRLRGDVENAVEAIQDLSAHQMRLRRTTLKDSTINYKRHNPLQRDGVRGSVVARVLR